MQYAVLHSNAPENELGISLIGSRTGPRSTSKLKTNERTPSMITNDALINQSKPGSGQEPINRQRRTLIGGALAALLSSPRRVMAQGNAVPKDPFVFLLKGVYTSVLKGQGPADNLGLFQAIVNLSDGTYSKTQIYAVHVEGIPCGAREDTAIGDFYVQFGSGILCAYQVPGGALAMQFACGGWTNIVSDGLNGNYNDGTWELTILEATGIYRSFQGGHNHMVDRLHFLASGNLDEYCFCFISRR